MKYRKVRIVWSACWGVVAFVLCVFWLRGYWFHDSVAYRRSGIHSVKSKLVVHVNTSPGKFVAYSRPIQDPATARFVSAVERVANRWGFGVTNDWGTYVYVVPQWMCTLVAIALAAVPWVTIKQFSLRTLLIATTLFAVVMGLIVWSAG